jgi:hypothetical protein
MSGRPTWVVRQIDASLHCLDNAYTQIIRNIRKNQKRIHHEMLPATKPKIVGSLLKPTLETTKR